MLIFGENLTIQWNLSSMCEKLRVKKTKLPPRVTRGQKMTLHSYQINFTISQHSSKPDNFDANSCFFAAPWDSPKKEEEKTKKETVLQMPQTKLKDFFLPKMILIFHDCPTTISLPRLIKEKRNSYMVKAVLFQI